MAKKHLSLIILVLLSSGLFYFLIGTVYEQKYELYTAYVPGIDSSSFKIVAEKNEIYSSSPHSMYLVYGQEPIKLSVITNQSNLQYCLNNIQFTSTNTNIAEIINGNKVKTNFDVSNEKNSIPNLAAISVYLPDCNILLSDQVYAISSVNFFKGPKAAFLMPPYGYDHSGNYFNLQQPLEDYDVETISSYAVDIQKQLMGRGITNGDQIIFQYDYRMCGGSGLDWPFVGFGAGCIIHNNNGIFEPSWDVYYHELGHAFTGYMFIYHQGLDTAYYSEGLASLNGMYTINKLIKDKSKYNISDPILSSLTSIKNNYNYFVTSQDCSYDSKNNVCNNNKECNDEIGENWRYCSDCSCSTSLWAYENLSEFKRNFSKIDANILDGMFIYLAEKIPNLNPYGWEIYPRFYKVFLEKYRSIVPTIANGKEATYIVAALSSAAGSDLRSLFADKWSFPVDNVYYAYIKLIFDSVISGSPVPPITLTATAISPTQVNLSWTSYPNASTYQIYRNNSWVWWTAANTTSVPDTNCTANTSYIYRIEARDAANNLLAQSNTVSAKTPPAVVIPPIPTGLTSTAGFDNIKWTWNASSGASYYTYKVYKGLSCVTYNKGSNTSNAFYKLTGLPRCETYSFKVKACNSLNQCSGYTGCVSGRTLGCYY